MQFNLVFRRAKWPVFCALAAILALAALTYHQVVTTLDEDLGFKRQTGIGLSTGVTAVAHGSEIDDNLFHRTHYWLLRGTAVSLRQLTVPFALGRSDEEAGWAVPDMSAMFGVKLDKSNLLEGYESTGDVGRNRWLIIFADGKTALFIY